MRKILTVLLTMAMVLSVMYSVAVAQETTGENYTGDWQMTGLITGGMEMPPAVLGMNMTLTLSESGVCVMDNNGNKTEGTWEMADSGIIVRVMADPLKFSLAEGKLVSEEINEVVMVYSRPTEQSPARKGVVQEDFEGTWNAVFMDMMGMQADTATLGMEIKLTITGAKVEMINTSVSEEPGVYDGVMDGHKLVFVDETAESKPEMRLSLLEDGTLALLSKAGTILFEKTPQ